MGKNERFERMHGKEGRKYGIWNDSAKQFQFGIVEDSPLLAEARLCYKIGDGAMKWRFSAKILPECYGKPTTPSGYAENGCVGCHFRKKCAKEAKADQ